MTSHGRQIIIRTINSKLHIMINIVQVKNIKYIDRISIIYIYNDLSINLIKILSNGII